LDRLRQFYEGMTDPAQSSEQEVSPAEGTENAGSKNPEQADHGQDEIDDITSENTDTEGESSED
jgi:hypothetical protein